MDVCVAVRNAWERVVEDFKEARMYAESYDWNEEVLRLSFFRHLLTQDIEIEEFMAEVEIWIWENVYHPDLIVVFDVDGETRRCAFEFKFWGNLTDWKKDWDNVLGYKNALQFDYGFFLAIGPSTRINEFPKGVMKQDHYQAEALIYGITAREAFGIPLGIIMARKLAGEILNMPLQAHEGIGLVKTMTEDCTIVFDLRSKEDKLLLILLLCQEPDSEKWVEFERRLRESASKGMIKEYVELDEESGVFQPCDSFTHAILLEELEVNNYPEMIKKARDSLTRIQPILNGLKPAIALR